MTLRRRQIGLSLIELMVSMTLGLIVLSGVLVVFVNSSAARNEVERTSRQIENGRYASELLTDDLRMAGFYGELDSSSFAVGGTLPDPCSLDATVWKDWIGLHTQGVDAASLSSSNCPMTNYVTGTDVLVVRRARTCIAGSANCDAANTAGMPYLQVSRCVDQSATPYVLGVEGTATFDRQAKTCLTTALADKRHYYVRVYFVATDNGIPTLKRAELTSVSGATQFQIVPLVEGIQNLQFVYGVDTTGDGAPDEYVADPGTPARWKDVVTVQFHILARNLEESSSYTDTKTYTLGKDSAGNAITVGPFNDKYRRHVYTGLVRIVNPAGRRDTP